MDTIFGSQHWSESYSENSNMQNERKINISFVWEKCSNDFLWNSIFILNPWSTVSFREKEYI